MVHCELSGSSDGGRGTLEDDGGGVGVKQETSRKVQLARLIA